ncbi:MAG TPA: FHA domain-containing protein [Ktedonobacterales bacterium]|nr:FHA domain-containing protein [Ktedonobacterales bacterium]
MPIVSFASVAPAEPQTSTSATAGDFATESVPERTPVVYEDLSPLTSAADQQPGADSETPSAPGALSESVGQAGGFADWQTEASGTDTATAADNDASTPDVTAGAAPAVYSGYLHQPTPDTTPPAVPESDLIDVVERMPLSDARAMSAYGLRYNGVTVESDTMLENATTSETSLEGSLTMMTATSVARVIVRSTAEGNTEQEREFALDGRTVTVGRSPACDISLEGDQLASRRHALLRAEGDRYTLVDLGSSNGSFVNDMEIHEPTVLHDGDHITVGEHDLLFLTSPASPSASVAGVRLDGDMNQQAPQSETSPHAAVVAGAQPDDEQAGYAQQFDQGQVGPAPSAPPVPTAPASGAIQPINPPTPSSTAGADALEQIRAQLTAASVALAQQSEAEARLADQRRAMVAEIGARLNDLLAQERSVAMPSSADVEALAQVARETAANPRHLDTLNALAARASDLAQALEAQRAWLAKRADLLDALDTLRSRLDQLG